MDNIERYCELLKRELELRELVIKTQNSTYEEERVKVALEREELLFKLTLDEIDKINKIRKNKIIT